MKNRGKTKRVFLDYASITPIDSRVEKEVQKIQKNFWGNPASLHTEGELAKNILEESRIKAARILHCRSSEIFFTGGGTESLNIAILGVVSRAREKMNTPHIIVSAVEHPAVLEPIRHLIKTGQVEVSFVNPDKNGIINPESIKKEIKDSTVLVAVMHANNEIGTVQPVSKISSVIKEYRQKNNSKFPYFLVDASQSFLFESVSLEILQADLIVLDGIKIYGPRGVGLLLLRSGIEINPIIFGGGQENSLRSGTQNVPSIAGFVMSLEIGVKMREKESNRLRILRDYLIDKVLKEFPNASLNGGLENRLPNNVNICFPGQDSEFLVIKLDTLGFAVSAASACHTLSLESSSYVIEAIGKKDCTSSSLRFTLGRDTKKQDLDKLIIALKKIL